METLRKNQKIRYFHLVPKTEFHQLKLPRNCDVLEVFFGLKDKLGESEPKKNIALKIYEQICPIYGKGPCPMKKKLFTKYFKTVSNFIFSDNLERKQFLMLDM